MRIPVLAAVVVAATSRVAFSSLIEGPDEQVNLLSRQGGGPPRPPPPPPGCRNNQSRLCWDGTYDINTNYYTSGPRTGRTVTYNFDIQNTTLSPDGRSRPVLAVNGQIPGPTIVANWGDRITINVHNSMQHNGTSIHWHGIRMLRNFLNDGVNGVTECPIAPNDTKTYSFIAEQYGTTWYHSHYSAQYGDGVWGTIQINGPATAEYDIDLGPISIAEWFATQTAYQKAYAAERGGPPPADNFIINGRNVNPLNTTQGTRTELVFTPGKKHRLRFVNTSVDSYFRVSLDGHNMTVIQSDFVPVNPYSVQQLGIAIGQRYDVIVEANQANSSYWLRTWPQACGAANANAGTGDANAYVRYAPVPAGTLPTTTSVTPSGGCADETSLVPYVQLDADSSGYPSNGTVMNVSAPFSVSTTGGNVFRWNIYGPVWMKVNMSEPSARTVQQAAAMPATMNSIEINGTDSSWVYWLIQNQFFVAHPIHWHLKDGYVISQGAGTFNASTAVLKWTNPPRRDVAMLPSSGYLLLAFKTDNPGIGIMHCHIAWHVSQGLSLQFVERKAEINFSGLNQAWTNTCNRWTTWYNSAQNVYGEILDSGLRKKWVL